MDASTLRVADTATIHLKSADGVPLYHDGKPVQITIYGPGSRQAAAVETAQTSRALKRMHDNDGKVTAPTAEERRQEAAQDLAAVTVSFDQLTYGDKTGTALFEAVYADAALGFIANQVQKASADWGKFKGAQPTA